MKLEKFIKNKKQKRILIGSIIGVIFLIGGIYLYRTYALYEEKKEFDVLKGKVPDFSEWAITYIVEGVETSKPSPTSGYTTASVLCIGVTGAYWDTSSWNITYNTSNLTSKEVTCTVSFNKYIESVLNGADPVLAENLIPVEIDETGKVTKANLNDEWYSYEEKKWANAVILEDESITYEDGEEIPESAIESYFVWIPKYDYKIQSLGVNTTQQAFEIRFGTENTSDEKEGECTTPSREVASGTNYYSGNCQVGDFMTHPAFIHFKDGIKGLWVGKFETGYKGATTTATAQVNSSDSTKVQIKPNVYSWRYITVSNAFQTSYNYQRELDSHTMKNTEWGAVAYLANSNYGRCTNGTCTQIYINTKSDLITGCTKTTTYFSGSVLASTTGNYFGIYDINGGAWEYIMGNINNTISSSGFSSLPDAKYYDKYVGNTSKTNYTGRILGDATAETKGWFGDYAEFPYTSRPWFIRGGSIQADTVGGAFDFGHYTGQLNSLGSFRIVLAI